MSADAFTQAYEAALAEIKALVAEVETLRAALRSEMRKTERGATDEWLDKRIGELLAAARGGDATFDPGSYDNAVRGVGRRDGDAT